MNVKDALTKVLKEMNELSPEQLRAELDKHKNGDIAVALRETQNFLENYNGSTSN